MKTILFSVLLLSQLIAAQAVTFNVLKEKTKVDKIGAITLYVEVINKSSNTVMLIKPAIDNSNKYSFYNVDMIKCDDTSIYNGMQDKNISLNESNLLKIAPKSKVIIEINGNYNGGMLFCNSKKFTLKLIYDVKKFLQNLEKLVSNTEDIAILRKLSSLKIESKIVNIIVP